MPPITTHIGRSIGLYADSGGGKTTLFGEYAKWKFKRTGQRSLYYAGDLGGFDSILPLVRLGIVLPIEFDPEKDDPWLWINNATEQRFPDGRLIGEDVGLIGFDSASSISEAILSAITKSPQQIGQQKTQRFNVARGNQTLTIGLNNEAHYGLVQGFMLDQIWKSTWLTRKGMDVLWTFAVDRSEKADKTPIIGPKLAGHALTAMIPKWFKYFFRLVSVPVQGEPTRHLLYLQEQPELGGMGMSFGNARYPIDATTQLPAVIEPASLVGAIEMIERGQQEAEDALRAELGL